MVLVLLPGPIFAQVEDYLKHNRKFHKSGYSKDRAESQMVSAVITA